MPRPKWNGTSALENPCYDTKTKTDCPDRCGGCQLDCPKWKAYTKKRDAEYEKRRVEHEVSSAYNEPKAQLRARYERRKMKNRRDKR